MIPLVPGTTYSTAVGLGYVEALLCLLERTEEAEAWPRAIVRVVGLYV